MYEIRKNLFERCKDSRNNVYTKTLIFFCYLQKKKNRKNIAAYIIGGSNFATGR